MLEDRYDSNNVFDGNNQNTGSIHDVDTSVMEEWYLEQQMKDGES